MEKNDAIYGGVSSLDQLGLLLPMQGGQRKRIIRQEEIDRFIELCRDESLAGKVIRVYSSDGFVANSYRYRARIFYLLREFDAETGAVNYRLCNTYAQRPRGAGSTVTVDGKAYGEQP